MRDFTGLLKVAEIEKSAKSILRLLSRVGDDFAGATARDLKFLSRRGFTGFNPSTVKALRAKGFLPTVEQELAGFNKGTENMFKWVPAKGVPIGASGIPVNYTKPIKQIIRTNSRTAEYGVDPISRIVTVPDFASASKSGVGKRERLASIARHEAREWVRSNSAASKGRNLSLPGHNGSLMDAFNAPEIGSSHMPGVIYDERVFRSQLANRLGINKRWDELPLVQGGGKTLVRKGSRDSYVGSRPLSYEFNLIKDWHKLNNLQRRRIKSVLGTYLYTPEVERLYGDAFAAINKTKASNIQNQLREAKDLVRKYNAGEWKLHGSPDRNRLIRARRTIRDFGYLEYVQPRVRQLLLDNIVRISTGSGLPGLIPPVLRPYQRKIERILSSHAKIPFNEFNPVVAGRHVHPPKGSDLGRVMSLSPYMSVT